MPKEAWRWPNFSPAEIACRGTGKLLINEAALDKLQGLRDPLGKPLIVRSAYRSQAHNRAVGGAKGLKHLEGAAFDIAMANHDPHAFEAAALATVGAAGVEVAEAALAETQAAVEPMVPYLDTLCWVFIAVALLGIGVAVYARWDDWREGEGMIGGVLGWLAGSRWGLPAAKWGAIGLTVLLFLLSVQRAGERAGRIAERLETMEKANDVQRRMMELEVEAVTSAPKGALSTADDEPQGLSRAGLGEARRSARAGKNAPP